MARLKGSKDSKARSQDTRENIRQSAIKRAHRKVLEYLESD